MMNTSSVSNMYIDGQVASHWCEKDRRWKYDCYMCDYYEGCFGWARNHFKLGVKPLSRTPAWKEDETGRMSKFSRRAIMEARARGLIKSNVLLFSPVTIDGSGPGPIISENDGPIISENDGSHPGRSGKEGGMKCRIKACGEPICGDVPGEFINSECMNILSSYSNQFCMQHFMNLARMIDKKV